MIEIGTVIGGNALTPVPVPTALAPTGARVVQVALQPDGRLVEARVAHVGHGAGRGAFWSPIAGDEVLVLLPGGDPLRAVVLGGLGGRAAGSAGRAPHPVAVTGLNAVLMHPAGVELRTVDGLPAHGIVLGTVLPDLASFVTALNTFVGTSAGAIAAACTTATPPQLAAIEAAKVAFLTDPAVTTFLAQLAASSAPTPSVPPGIGGLPYASPLNRSTA